MVSVRAASDGSPTTIVCGSALSMADNCGSSGFATVVVGPSEVEALLAVVVGATVLVVDVVVVALAGTPSWVSN